MVLKEYFIPQSINETFASTFFGHGHTNLHVSLLMRRTSAHWKFADIELANMTSTAVLQQVLNTASAQGFVVVAKTAFQPAKPVTLKEVLERLDLQAISRINTSQLSQVLKSDMGDADENPTKKLMLLQSDMDLTDQEHLRVMQTLEGAKLATIDIVGPEMFGIVVGEGELKHTFKKSGNILLIDNYAGKEIIKISGELLIPNSPEKRPSFSELVPEIRQLILAAAARLEVPREVVVTEVNLVQKPRHTITAVLTRH